MSTNIHINIISKSGEDIAQIPMPQTTTDESYELMSLKTTKERIKALDSLLKKHYNYRHKEVMRAVNLAVEEFGIDYLSICFW